MAITQTHFRSISFPSRLHPINPSNFETDLESFQISPNSQAIQSDLLRLAQLYNSLHHEIAVSADQKSTEESLSASVELLDSCNNIRELIQMMRENVQTLQSALRRKGLDNGIQNDVASYFSLRKKMNKCASKSLKTLRNLENNKGSSLSEVCGLTIAIFKCTLVFLSSPAVANSGGWNVVSKLMMTKSDKDRSVVSEVGCVDLGLHNLQRSFRSDCKVVDRQTVQSNLKNLEASIQGIETGLEILFRRLLQTRVSLLNILTQY